MSFALRASPENPGVTLEQIVAQLPPLPRVVQYEDDYDEVIRKVEVEQTDKSLTLIVSGSSRTLNMLHFDMPLREIVRHFLLTELLFSAPSSIVLIYQGLRGILPHILGEIILMTPLELKDRWSNLAADFTPDAAYALKSLLRRFCNIAVGNWAPQYRELVSNLAEPQADPYSSVRSGDCFISIEEEAKIVRYLDQSSASVSSLTTKELRRAALVLCSYQFGMRPKQLGTLRKRDCNIRTSQEDGLKSAYLTFRTIKQRDLLKARLPLLRKVKREWAPLIVATYELLHLEPTSAFFFGFNSRLALSKALIEKLGEILSSERRAAYDLRHSMAQRMVDAGASQEEIAAALGHTSLRSGLVYFRASANQAELVNKALGLSETYQSVAKIAANRFISQKELAELKGDQQIAGVPHGIPIAGIGACETSQPLCSYNPITACYGCPKFLPVRDKGLHEQVLMDFRSVVNDFRAAGMSDQISPAYLQLQRTIAEVQSVINQLEGRDEH